jgi:hypothetical protein
MILKKPVRKAELQQEFPMKKIRKKLAKYLRPL